MNNDAIRIGVLGDLHTGKSSLIHQLCHPHTPPTGDSCHTPTVDVLDFRRRTQNIWVEFIVFPSETRHALPRQMLYGAGIDALFVVCDCADAQTFAHACKWIEEAAGHGLSGPVALVLGGHVRVDGPEPGTPLAAAVGLLVSEYRVSVLNLSGPLAAGVELGRGDLASFFDLVYCTKKRKRV